MRPITPTNSSTNSPTNSPKNSDAHSVFADTQLVDKIHPTTGQEGPEGRIDIACSIFNLGATWGWVVKATPGPLYPRCPRTVAENLASIGIRFADRPAHNESL